MSLLIVAIGCLNILSFALQNLRGVAQPGSALVWGASGRRFKSGRPDQILDCQISHSLRLRENTKMYSSITQPLPRNVNL